PPLWPPAPRGRPPPGGSAPAVRAARPAPPIATVFRGDARGGRPRRRRPASTRRRHAGDPPPPPPDQPAIERDEHRNPVRRAGTPAAPTSAARRWIARSRSRKR